MYHGDTKKKSTDGGSFLGYAMIGLTVLAMI